MKLLSEMMTKKVISTPYVPFSCLDATGISEQENSSQIIHWGPTGKCAIAIGNQVYLVQPIIEESNNTITACVPPYVITSLRWLDSTDTKVSVIAIATNCPEGLI